MVRGIIASIMLGVAIGSGIIYLGLQPTTLKLAIAAEDKVDRAIFEAAATALKDKRRQVRLAIKLKPTNEDVAVALGAGTADLGVLRSDATTPTGVEAVLILRREAVVLVAPEWAEVGSFTDLADKRVAIVRHGGPAGHNINILRDYYGLAAARAHDAVISFEELEEALAAKRFDAYALVGSPTSGPLSASVRRIANASDGKIVFINIDEAEAISRRGPDAEALRIPEGTFGGRPPLPRKELLTLAAPVRLVARPDLDDQPISELARQLIAMRSVLRRVAPGAESLETPDPDTSQMLVQAGARAFRDGDEQTFLDRYSDYLYLSLFLVGGLGSMVTAVTGRFQRRQRQTVMRVLEEVMLTLDKLPRTPSLAQLDEADLHIADVYRLAMQQAAECNLSADDIAAFSLALSHAQTRIDVLRTRAELAAAQPPRPVAAVRTGPAPI
ncbi:TAXI family TRAP transporter solute-binding subunit [Chelatococcus reniformis]|uniref:C4-dicarboxylate ABC transporter substrate-binding protein n=1 Tax=Chelatococcus reniformis TaxID=1494448 RepID=A0A916TY83_9HYPH|nr:TAXI family TRAP transporter solute-binding subunit [Chelatococcus reniformis]GGC51877.1 hypothetical protein GCM10010994_08730 [Chelatococcus reniformis]